MEFLPVRIYAHDAPSGYRLLVDRVWPRGISKEHAALDDWAKALAPTTELRKWFGHDPAKFTEFQQRYLAELDANPAVATVVTELRQAAPARVLVLYGAKDETHNNAVILAPYLAAKVNA
ncbi:DUF488 domain-containing protein [Lacticaseibacillus nasuensis]|uniref:Uroporphyrin-III C-methyltransferase n=1 Tax=Lacticaseibacillus nasuensis JCM 17158 TaxID=1291734 RepID=A0A0R1JI50_9LACO|nr:DUF488 family protein [Lacticaseibacillus nasuensis]KRK70973.1 hypothetical protein FD02_GL000154 [Lacticaseibacillus nasuensis JCM 17158]